MEVDTGMDNGMTFYVDIDIISDLDGRGQSGNNYYITLTMYMLLYGFAVIGN